MQRSSRMTSAGFWLGRGQAGAPLLAHGANGEERREMRAEYCQRLYRVMEALDPRATTLDLAPGDLEGLSPTDRQQLQPVRQTGHASSGRSPEPQ